MKLSILFSYIYILCGCHAAALFDNTTCAVSSTTLPTATITQCPGNSVQTYTTVFSVPCSTGLTRQTFTVTETCTKSVCHPSSATSVPLGFTTAVVYCTACGGPSTVTETVTCPTASLSVYTQWGWVISPSSPTEATSNVVPTSSFSSTRVSNLPTLSSAKTLDPTSGSSESSLGSVPHGSSGHNTPDSATSVKASVSSSSTHLSTQSSAAPTGSTGTGISTGPEYAATKSNTATYGSNSSTSESTAPGSSYTGAVYTGSSSAVSVPFGVSIVGLMAIVATMLV